MTSPMTIVALDHVAPVVEPFKAVEHYPGVNETTMPGNLGDVGGDRYLVVSPYTKKEHLLDLETLDTQNRLLALALTRMRCLRTDYATAPYQEAFNWEEVVDTLRGLAREQSHSWTKSEWYIVVFRSRIPPSTACAELAVLDKAAHAEATSSGGFLK